MRLLAFLLAGFLLLPTHHTAGGDGPDFRNLEDARSPLQDATEEIDIGSVRVQAVFTTLALSFGFLFLVLFFFLPRDRAFLYFAMMMLTLGLALFFDYQDQFSDVGWYISLQRALLCAGLVFGLRFLYSLFLPHPPRAFLLISTGFVAAGILTVMEPRANMPYLAVMIFVMWGESLRVLFGAVRKKERGAWIIATGFSLFFLTGLYDLLLDAGVINPIYSTINGYQFGFLSLCLGSAIYLGQGVSLSNRRLVDQELQIRERELERQLLDAEMSRKTKELKDARDLQLSMLPAKLPTHPQLSFAAFMEPATEVGGDYYDFAIEPDDTITVAVGDATGHGLRAGMMVAIAKSLFAGGMPAPNIPAYFGRCTHVLKQMNLGNLFMGLTILRFRGTQFSVSSAGMPPILVYRAQRHAVEPIVLKGMPLGAFEDFRYATHTGSLQPGDVVLAMTDGFTELFNGEREMLGDASAIDLFREAARGDAASIVDELVAGGEAWRDGHPQDDDVTFVVIKANESEPT